MSALCWLDGLWVPEYVQVDGGELGGWGRIERGGAEGNGWGVSRVELTDVDRHWPAHRQKANKWSAGNKGKGKQKNIRGKTPAVDRRSRHFITFPPHPGHCYVMSFNWWDCLSVKFTLKCWEILFSISVRFYQFFSSHWQCVPERRTLWIVSLRCITHLALLFYFLCNMHSFFL